MTYWPGFAFEYLDMVYSFFKSNRIIYKQKWQKMLKETVLFFGYIQNALVHYITHDCSYISNFFTYQIRNNYGNNND